MATLNQADIYGGRSANTMGQPDIIGVGGPNQSSVASTAVMQPGGIGAAASWVGFALLLILLRIAIEMGGRSG